MQNVNDIRAGFLEFFRRNGHEVRPSGPLVPLNDPTLMFANAGMNQFKNVFTGAEKLPYVRAASSQKCVRAGGKHNDLDNVGYTARHHTFFEMLGNFSFGDYFKEGAIEFAWNLLTKEFGLNPDKLSFTVYHTDDEAFNLWKKITGCADGKILRIPTKDNFWAMGDTGPCGPCSEIFYDHGDAAGNGEWALNSDGSDRFDARFVEIWNLVFMQYEQVDADTRVNLPKPSIDTGMGLERIAAVMQGVHDNYDIDLFRHLIADIKDNAAKLGGKRDGEPAAYKVLADHLRSSCFLIADGVLPSNEGRGYVLRRIMRRAMRYAHQLGCREPLMHHLVPALVSEMSGAYPELKRAEATIVSNLREEEERFKQTLERGLKLLEEAVTSSCGLRSSSTGSRTADTVQPQSGSQRLSGDIAFKLYDTYGFPLDLTQDILRTRGMEVDTEGFEKAMEGQREMARAAWSGSGDKATGKIWFEIREKTGATEFVGYDADEADATILGIVKNNASVPEAKAGDEAFLVLDKTPFYGESGGQAGDSGRIEMNGMVAANVADTQKPVEDLHVHKVKLDFDLHVGDKVHAVIDTPVRDATRANHSATHLLHKALRDALGDHVTQKGSLVESEGLRFDFSHPKAVTPQELAAIEHKVNDIIRRNTKVATDVKTPEEAIKAGAMALFGEKYGDKVRMLSIGTSSCGPRSGSTGSQTAGDPAQPPGGSQDDVPYSVELCGGTHVRSTGEIGLFKITSEGSVASGIRRIEAVTGEGVRHYFEKVLGEQASRLHKLEEDHAKLSAELAALTSPLPAGGRVREGASGEGLPSLAPTPPSPLQGEGDYHAQQALFMKESAAQLARIEQLQEANKKLGKDVAEAKKLQALSAGGDVKAETIGGVTFIGKSFDGLDPKELRPLIENYARQAQVVAVGTHIEGKASVAVAVAKDLTGKLSAVALVQAAVAILGGKGGGGRPDMAQGGGPEADKLDAALNKIKSMI